MSIWCDRNCAGHCSATNQLIRFFRQFWNFRSALNTYCRTGVPSSQLAISAHTEPRPVTRWISKSHAATLRWTWICLRLKVITPTSSNSRLGLYPNHAVDKNLSPLICTGGLLRWLDFKVTKNHVNMFICGINETIVKLFSCSAVYYAWPIYPIRI